MLTFLLLIGTLFGALAGLSAFLITWSEYEKHQFTRQRLWRESLSMAVFAFAFFLLVTLIIGYVFSHDVITR